MIFFGHVFSKEGMSPDPEKVEHIKSWPEPQDKSKVKSFLQTVQFVAPYMRVGPRNILRCHEATQTTHQAWQSFPLG